ncbi:MAG: hypothetical protein KY476_15715 [Planctomycetes bacterium]|nr:hypothetical protein [Planctomycetota bacterium]
MADLDQLKARVVRWQWGSLIAGALGLAACAFAFVDRPEAFFQSWLLGYIYWWSVAIGCLTLLSIHHMTGGKWGWAVRPFLSAGVATLPLLAVAFIPVWYGMERLYPWTRESVLEQFPLVRHKTPYLNVPFFVGRAIACYLIWMALGLLLTRRGRTDGEVPHRPQALPKKGNSPLAAVSSGSAQSKEGDSPLFWAKRPALYGRVGAAGMILVVLTGTIAAIDWVMSLEPLWYSSIFGPLMVAGGVVGAMALACCSLGRLTLTAGQSPPVPGDVRNDLGNLLLAFVMIWAYFSISQYIIIWSVNLPSEAFWFVKRQVGGWELLAIAVALLHFLAPFLCLLSRDAKQSPRTLAFVASLLLVMHAADQLWIIAPSFDRIAFRIAWTDVAAWLGLGGVFLAIYAARLKAGLDQLRLLEAEAHERPHDD